MAELSDEAWEFRGALFADQHSTLNLGRLGPGEANRSVSLNILNSPIAGSTQTVVFWVVLNYELGALLLYFSVM